MNSYISTVEQAWSTACQSEQVKRHIAVSVYFSFLLVVLTEITMSILIDGNIGWIYKRLNHWLIISTLLVFTCVQTVNLLVNRLRLSLCITGTAAVFLSYAHIVKSSIRFSPLHFSDYQHLREGIYGLSLVFESTSAIIAFFFLALLGLLVLHLGRKGVPALPWQKRIALFAIPLFINPGLFTLLRVDYKDLFYQHKTSSCYVAKSGLYSFLLLSAFHTRERQVPADYSRESIDSITRKYQGMYEQTFPETAQKIKPNIIFFSIESFFDPQEMGVRYTQDPIPFFHSLQHKFGKKTFITSTYGGGTDIPEFEILTGFTKNRVREPTPNLLILNHPPFPNLVNTLRETGYFTMGIEASNGKNFHRDKAYPHLGFHTLRALADEDADREQTWKKTSDNLMVSETLKEIENHSPILLYAQTNASHGKYTPVEINPDFAVLNTNIRSKAKILLQKYAQAIHLSDLALKRLVQSLEHSGTKTVLFIFGDHKPGKLGTAYKDMGVFSGSEQEHYFNKYQTPLVIWHNLDSFSCPDIISANNLASTLLDHIHIPDEIIPLQLKMNRLFLDTLPVVSLFYLTSSNDYYEDATLQGSPYAGMVNDYHLLQYDILEGEQYALPYNNKVSPYE